MQTFKEWISENSNTFDDPTLRWITIGGTILSKTKEDGTKEIHRVGGKRILINKYTGEIKAGIGGKFNGKVLGKDKLDFKNIENLDNIMLKSPTYKKCLDNPYTPSKTVKECEDKIRKIFDGDIALKGVSNTEVLDMIGNGIHSVLSKYPLLGDKQMKSLLNIGTGEGLKASKAKNLKKILNNKEIVEKLSNKADSNFDRIFKKRFQDTNANYSVAAFTKVLKLKSNSKEIKDAIGDSNIYSTIITEDIARKIYKSKYINENAKEMCGILDNNTLENASGVYYRNNIILCNVMTYFNAPSLLKNSIEQGYLSDGNTMVHELGHALEDLLDLDNEEFYSKLDDLTKKYKMTSISRYAQEHYDKSNSLKDDKKLQKLYNTRYCELIAESFSEYMVSKNPRPLAVEVGKLIDEEYKKYEMKEMKND